MIWSVFPIARRAGLAALTAGLALALGACSEKPSTSRHEQFSGIVEGLKIETGELTVRTPLRGQREEEQRIQFLFTNDSEIYVSDAYAGRDAIRLGDVIELIAYRDPNPRAERYVVESAYVSRPEKPPPKPDVWLTTGPSSRPQE